MEEVQEKYIRAFNARTGYYVKKVAYRSADESAEVSVDRGALLYPFWFFRRRVLCVCVRVCACACDYWDDVLLYDVRV